VRTLNPGSYTAILGGKGAGGVGVVEVYDLGTASGSELANMSTRGLVGAGDQVMIGGLIVGGPEGSNARVVMRALGPEVPVPNRLSDPTLEMHDQNGVIVASNNDWKDTQRIEIETSGIAPGDDRESAIIGNFTPGQYTAIVRGATNSTGVALLEIYHLP
jgi:hypothetical protein